MTLFLFGSNNIVQAKQNNINTINREETETNFSIKNKVTFTDLSPKEMEKMSANLEHLKNSDNKLSNNIAIQPQALSLSSGMANLLNTAGFKESGYLLDYSMKPLREEPLELYNQNDPAIKFTNDFWNNSPQFKNAVIQFLSEANAAHSYQYFKSTTISFDKPSASNVSILANSTLKAQTDLFGSLHLARLNLGVVKEGGIGQMGNWHVLVDVEDRYDFEQQAYDTFTGLVNNIAYYDQERGNIRPYDLYIDSSKTFFNSLPYYYPIW